MKNKLLLTLTFLIAFGGGTGFGWYIYNQRLNPATITLNNAVRENGFKFISPLLIGADTVDQSAALNSFKNKIYQETFDTLNDPQINTLSFYFRDLISGRWIGTRENAIYDSASLLKVPLLIAYLKESESNPFLFSKKLLYRGEPLDNKNLPFYNLKPGNEYTIGELITDMIVKSDNSAKDVLFNSLDPNFRNSVFQDLGIPVIDPNAQYQISPKTYSLFFRLLYNSTYLTKGDSEKALELLSNSEYQDGLVAGVPPTITISHKFGQFGITAANDTTWELHDCGIVYYSERPYLLCIMTKGQDLEKLGGLIKTISQIAYKYVDNNFQ